jgi:hypothetical protein
MLNDMDCHQAVEGIVRERIREPIQVTQHVRMSGRVPVNTDSFRLFFDAAANVENPQFAHPAVAGFPFQPRSQQVAAKGAPEKAPGA